LKRWGRLRENSRLNKLKTVDNTLYPSPFLSLCLSLASKRLIDLFTISFLYSTKTVKSFPMFPRVQVLDAAASRAKGAEVELGELQVEQMGTILEKIRSKKNKRKTHTKCAFLASRTSRALFALRAVAATHAFCCL
jgi:hypothetical protein